MAQITGYHDLSSFHFVDVYFIDSDNYYQQGEKNPLTKNLYNDTIHHYSDVLRGRKA